MKIEQVKEIKTLEEARMFAIDWQSWISKRNRSYFELAEWSEVFMQLVDRFPELKEEFEENGII